MSPFFCVDDEINRQCALTEWLDTYNLSIF